MKAISILIGLFFYFLGPPNSFSQESVYTWTDQNGVVNISNRKPNKNVRLQEVDLYKVPKDRSVKDNSRNIENKIDSTKIQTQIKQAEKKVSEAERKAREAREFAEKAKKAADDFRDKLGVKKKRWRKNRSRMKKMDEQAKQAEQQAKAAEEIARAARAAASALKRAGEIETASKNRPQ